MTTSDPWRRLRAAVRDERRERRWSQQDLATRANVARPTISNLETGNAVDPDKETVQRIAKAFGWDDKHVAELIAGTAPVAYQNGAVSRELIAMARRVLPGADELALENYAKLLTEQERIARLIEETEARYRR